MKSPTTIDFLLGSHAFRRYSQLVNYYITRYVDSDNPVERIVHQTAPNGQLSFFEHKDGTRVQILQPSIRVTK